LGGADAVSKPWKLTLEKNGRARFGLWKNIDGTEGGAPDRWRYEIAAYRLSLIVGVEMVPATVERRFNGEKGSLQLWMNDTASLKKLTQAGRAVPPERTADWNRAAYLQRAFDSLIAGIDRNANNILVTPDWRMILVDHSRAFRFDPPFGDGLLFGAAGLMKGPDGGSLPLWPLPRKFVDALRGLEAKAVKAAVKPHLTDREIKAVIVRAGRLLAEIDAAVAAKGEDKVLYE
jgi:hypothetical protein